MPRHHSQHLDGHPTGHQGACACQPREHPRPRQCQLDLVLLEQRLEQITAFTNKVTEDGARTHIVNSEGSARLRTLPGLTSPHFLVGEALLGPGRESAQNPGPPSGGQGRGGQGSDQGTGCCRAAPHTQASAGGFVAVPQSCSSEPGHSLKSRKFQSILEARCLPLFLLINFSKMHCQSSPQKSPCRWAKPNGLPFVCEPTWPLAESN